MSIILFDTTSDHHNLLPLTFTRAVAHIRCGINTLAEKWNDLSPVAGVLTQDYLQPMYAPAHTQNPMYIRGSVIASQEIFDELQQLKTGEALFAGEQLVGFKSEKSFPTVKQAEEAASACKKIIAHNNPVFILFPWDIFVQNGNCIRDDVARLTINKRSQPLGRTNVITAGSCPIFLEEGAKAEGCLFNTTDGPIYLGKNSEVMEGSMIRGPFALGEDAVLKMGTKIYGATTIGPHCKVGGEVNNSVFFAYSNKAHDGFIGNSVIGEWCNLGADTNNSNLKNNYSNVSIWNYTKKAMMDTGRQFCGIFMGDHSKSGINSMFNTGSVIGVSANIFGGDFPPKHIPSFSWGGASGFEKFDFAKALEVANRMKERRGLKVEAGEEKVLKYIFDSL